MGSKELSSGCNFFGIVRTFMHSHDVLQDAITTGLFDIFLIVILIVLFSAGFTDPSSITFGKVIANCCSASLFLLQPDEIKTKIITILT